MKLTKKKILIVVIVVIAFIIVMVYTVLNIGWGIQLEGEIALLKKLGEPMTLAEVKPKPVPASDNAAIEYEQIFIIISDGTFSMRNAGKKADRWDDFEKWAKGNGDMKELERQCKEESGPLRKIIQGEECRRVFVLLQKAASKPGMDFNLNYEEGPDLPLPHLSYMRFLARMQCVRAQLEFESGNCKVAWDRIIEGLKISRHLRNEPLLISQLVCFAMEKIMLEFIGYNLPKYGISDSQAYEIIEFLGISVAEYKSSMQKTVQAERVLMGGWAFSRLIDGRIPLKEIWRFNESGGHVPLFFVRPVLKRDYVEYLRFIQSYKDDYNNEYYSLKEKSKDKDERLSKEIPSYCIVTRILAPSIGRIRLKTAEQDAYANMARIRCALEIYKNKNGQYPENLSQLAPDIIVEIPVNGITGGLFGYVKNGNVYELSREVKNNPE